MNQKGIFVEKDRFDFAYHFDVNGTNHLLKIEGRTDDDRYPKDLQNLVQQLRSFEKNKKGYKNILNYATQLKLKELATGGEGTVYCSVGSTGKCEYIMKIYKLLDSSYGDLVKSVEYETKTTNELHINHKYTKNTIKMYPPFVNDEDEEKVIVFMEYAKGQTFDNYMKQPDINFELKLIMSKRIADLIENLNNDGYYHGDLGFNNIIISPSNDIILIDFTKKDWPEPWFDMITYFYYLDFRLRNYRLGSTPVENVIFVAHFYRHVFVILSKLGGKAKYEITRTIIGLFLYVLGFSIRIDEILYRPDEKSMFTDDFLLRLTKAKISYSYMENAIEAMENPLSKPTFELKSIEKYNPDIHGNNMLEFYQKYVCRNFDIQNNPKNQEIVDKFKNELSEYITSGNKDRVPLRDSVMIRFYNGDTIGSMSIMAFSQILSYYALANVFYYDSDWKVKEIKKSKEQVEEYTKIEKERHKLELTARLFPTPQNILMASRYYSVFVWGRVKEKELFREMINKVYSEFS